MKTFYFFFIAFILNASLANAQFGANDPNFNKTDLGFGLGEKADDVITEIVKQPDGKLIIAGGFKKYDGIPKNQIARLNADGSLDETFVGPGPNGTINALALQSDGKILIGGFFDSYNNIKTNTLARLNRDGSLDESFKTTLLSTNFVTAIAVLPDGKILIAASVVGRILKLNADGSNDTTFTPGTGANTAINTIRLYDNKIIITGVFTSFNGTAINRIAILNQDGSLDTSFSPVSGPDENVTAVDIQQDGKIVIGGNFNKYNGVNVSSVARINPDGTLDATFALTKSWSYSVRNVEIQSDGKILVSGDMEYYAGGTKRGILRILPSGDLDTNFLTGTGTEYGDIIYGTSTDASGKIIVAGRFRQFNKRGRNNIAQLNADGSLADSFLPVSTGASGAINSLLIQSDDKILISGNFNFYNKIERHYIARLLADGTLDESFDAQNAPPILATAIQPDGKILVGGAFSSFNGVQREHLARLNTDGSVDMSFNPGDWDFDNNGTVNSISIQADGKILIGGKFRATGNYSQVKRFNADGSPDATFNLTTKKGTVYKVLALADGKVLIAGAFGFDPAVFQNKFIARLNADGTVDTSFSDGAGVNYDFGDPAIFNLVPQSDGKILFTGDFTKYDGKQRTRIARINADGSLDETFNALPAGINDKVGTISFLPEGKIFIGTMSFYDFAISDNVIKVLNSDGTPDTSFTFQGKANGSIYSSVILKDGKIIISGKFTSFEGIGRNRITRLLKECEGQINADLPVLEATKNSVCAGTSTKLSIKTGVLPPSAKWNWYTESCGGTLIGTGPSIDVSPIIETTYFVRAEGGCVTPGPCSAITIKMAVPVISVTPGERCGTGTVTLNAKVDGAVLSWYNGKFTNESLGTGESFVTPSISFTTPYYVDAVKDGCTSARIEVMATIKPLPVVTVTLSESAITASTSEREAKFQWINCADDHPVEGETVKSFTPTLSGSYAVTVTGKECSVKSNCVNVVITGIEALNEKVQIYPNPGKGKITLSFDTAAVHYYEIKDMSGRMIYSGKSTQKIAEVDLNQPAGIYIISVSSDDKVQHFKLVVE